VFFYFLDYGRLFAGRPELFRKMLRSGKGRIPMKKLYNNTNLFARLAIRLMNLGLFVPQGIPKQEIEEVRFWLGPDWIFFNSLTPAKKPLVNPFEKPSISKKTVCHFLSISLFPEK